MPLGTASWHDPFLLALSNELSQEPVVGLNLQCLSRYTLYQWLAELKQKGVKFPSARQAIEWLVEVRVLTAVPVQLPIDGVGQTGGARLEFYSFRFGRLEGNEPSYLELLQAYDAKGVICGFSALQFHALTTQLASHHQIAIPTPRAKPNRASPSIASGGERKQRDSLGTQLFQYQGVPYYKTMRESRLMPGTQLRYVGPTAIIRITTLEQSLLDTLHNALAAGGPSVVFEAWERGLERARQHVLADYLQKMDRTVTAQRLGWILERMDYSTGPELHAALEHFRPQWSAAGNHRPQQLFPGIAYNNLSDKWQIYGPE